MRSLLLKALTGATILALHSCTEVVNCYDEPLAYTTVGYTAGEVDTVIVYRYKQGNKFVTPEDTVAIHLQKSQYQPAKDDTLRLNEMNIIGYSPGAGVALQATNDKDYKVYFPNVDRTYYITEITDEGRVSERMKKNKRMGCSNNIVSYKINDVYYAHKGGTNIIYLAR